MDGGLEDPNILVRILRAKFPATEPCLDLRKLTNDLIHAGPLGGILLNHACNKWVHELEALSLLCSI
jgi:hypothetical protein